MKHLLMGEYAHKWSTVGPFLIRVVVGLVFAAHGWQKLAGGVPGTAAFLSSLGFPAPEVFAVLLIIAELGGGLLLILGLFTTLAAKLTTIVALVALLTVHLKNGFFMATGGYEFILVLLVASVSLILTGPGRWALERKLFKR